MGGKAEAGSGKVGMGGKSQKAKMGMGSSSEDWSGDQDVSAMTGKKHRSAKGGSLEASDERRTS
jgi:hypothetical protein